MYCTVWASHSQRANLGAAACLHLDCEQPTEELCQEPSQQHSGRLTLMMEPSWAPMPGGGGGGGLGGGLGGGKGGGLGGAWVGTQLPWAVREGIIWMVLKIPSVSGPIVVHTSQHMLSGSTHSPGTSQ